MHTTLKPTLPLGLFAFALALASGPAPAAPAAAHSLALATPAETTPVFRAQLEVTTCDKEDADTDDAVSAQINDAYATRLDYGRDDFERDETLTYDLGLDGVTTIADITKLRISKTGSDWGCLSSVRLLINGAPIFVYAPEDGARWLDNDQRTLEYDRYQLRANPAWKAYDRTTEDYLRSISRTVTEDELESRIESMIGTLIGTNALEWGPVYGEAVEVWYKSSTTVHVDLDLSYSVNGPDPEVDVDFDLVLCQNNQFRPRIINTKVEVDAIISHPADAYLESMLNSMLNAAVVHSPGCFFGLRPPKLTWTTCGGVSKIDGRNQTDEDVFISL